VSGPELDPRVRRRYDVGDEDARLWGTPRGELIRIRTWDIFDRFLPPTGLVADVGGGPGTHASHLAGLGYEVVVIEPHGRHLEHARRRSAEGPPFEVRAGDARALPLDDGSVDVVALMGPLYHLVDPADRGLALREARRVLRPGGRLVAETISRAAWLMDATMKGRLGEADVWEQFTANLTDGMSHPPGPVPDGHFFAYFHAPDELAAEVRTAGFGDGELVAVEGFAWLLGDLDSRLHPPDDLLRALRLIESDPSMLGASCHVMAIASRP
jgi:SAM-dependent methyltransferase